MVRRRSTGIRLSARKVMGVTSQSASARNMVATMTAAPQHDLFMRECGRLRIRHNYATVAVRSRAARVQPAALVLVIDMANHIACASGSLNLLPTCPSLVSHLADYRKATGYIRPKLMPQPLLIGCGRRLGAQARVVNCIFKLDSSQLAR
jgi:hypothetical protein